ncbi:uncharacterized protein LOC127566295 [Drosophila albomicans]|uniref:Uncharacterized protein LOC127566295 n=1 Tax=Drosophila albomicans TaxID=7291 RepID=A0A9C6W9D3_DROAB|nr:uncharacterized protein LOC127566295 [Drosophila albomicans]
MSTGREDSFNGSRPPSGSDYYHDQCYISPSGTTDNEAKNQLLPPEPRPANNNNNNNKTPRLQGDTTKSRDDEAPKSWIAANNTPLHADSKSAKPRTTANKRMPKKGSPAQKGRTFLA